MMQSTLIRHELIDFLEASYQGSLLLSKGCMAISMGILPSEIGVSLIFESVADRVCCSDFKFIFEAASSLPKVGRFAEARGRGPS